MEPLRLDYHGLHEYQQNRYPYLLIDVAEEVIPGVSAKGFKHLSNNEWFFDVHFPGDPNMPGMLQIEAMVQLAALTVLTLPNNKGKVAYLTGAKNLKFVRKVVPGDKLEFETELLSWKRGMGRCKGRGTVGGALACAAEFSLVMPSILEEYAITSRLKEAAASSNSTTIQ